ncbi:hypothetical protein GW17_00030138 [Ensete ventricosum]|nr:hypothetical protein GW17_00030138 [Ensete ventricosum]
MQDFSVSKEHLGTTLGTSIQGQGALSDDTKLLSIDKSYLETVVGWLSLLLMEEGKPEAGEVKCRGHSGGSKTQTSAAKVRHPSSSSPAGREVIVLEYLADKVLEDMLLEWVEKEDDK